MALYTFKSEEEAMNPLRNYTGNSKWVRNQMASYGLGPSVEETKIYNAIGRDAGNNTGGNFFEKKANSIGNAIGTTAAAIASPFINEAHTAEMSKTVGDTSKGRQAIAEKYGYKDIQAMYDALNNAEESGDTETANRLLQAEQEDKDLTSGNAKKVRQKANEYKDYVQNNELSKRINQDQGKFAGSAINTLSTAADVMLPGAGIAFNTVQGGVEGIADELEQNGLQNFDWERAKQNALSGALTGAVVGGVNKGISNALAKNGGNLLKGGNKVTQAINSFNATNPIGQVGSALGMGATRGAVSGAVGGATGAGVQSALAGQDLGQGIASALQGAVEGAKQGAVTGGIMTGANMLANKTPGVGGMMQKLNEAGEDWNARKAEGQSFGQRLGETWDESTTKRVSDKIGQELGKSWDATKQGFKNVGEGLAILNERGLLPSPGMIVKDVSGDGMLNMKRGEQLPLNAKLKTLSELTDGQYKTIGDMMNDGLTLDDIKAVLPKSDYEAILQNAREFADINNPLEQMNQYNDRSKSNLPQLNRDEWYSDTIGSVKDRQSAADIPDYMQKHLSNKVARGNDEILRDYFMDNNTDNTKYTLSELYELYDRIANGSNANETYTPENIENGLMLAGDEGNRITTELANRLFGSTRDIGVENANNRAQDIAVKSTTMPQDIKNMQINDGTQLPPETGGAGDAGGTPPRNPATELYNSLNRQPEEPIDLTDAFGDKGLGTIEQRNKAQSLGRQLQNAAKTQKYGPVFDSLDEGTARRAVETQAPQRLADLGIQPQDYTEAAKVSSYVNRVVSDLADKSKVKVNVPDLADQLSASSLTLPFGSDSNRKTYEQAIRSLTTPDGGSPAQYTVSKLLETSRKLGQKAFDAKGNTDSAKELRNAYSEAKHAMRDIASEALTQSGITGDATTEMIAKGLKDLGANQATIDYICAPENGKAPSAKELIRRTSLFEQARDMGNQIEAEKYRRSASKQPTRFATKLLRASGIEQPLETALRSIVAPVASGVTNLAGKAIEGVGNLGARVGGNGGDITPTETSVATPVNNNYNPATQIYNMIGREEGNRQNEQMRTANYLADTVQEARQPQTLEDMMATPTSANTAVYNSMTGNAGTTTPTTTTTASNTTGTSTQGTGNPYFQQSGDYWTDILGRALSKAIDANDVEAFAALYGMYQDAIANVQKQSTSNETSTSQKKITATQQRANAAMNSLNRIMGMEPDLGYNLSGIPVIGNIATLGGNDYQAEATSLAQQIGYMVSGANIKEEEAENIGKAYVPQPFDSEATRRNKLQRAYEIIQSYQNGYEE